MRIRRAIVLLVALGLAAGAYRYWGQGSAVVPPVVKPGQDIVPVAAAPVLRKVMPNRIRAIGTVQAFASVAVKSRLDGEIVEVGFKEGQDVAAGDLLFVIDPRPLQASLRQAEANLARDKAQLASTRADVARYTDLLKKDFVSHQTFEKAVASLATVQATIQADQAMVDGFKVQLGYATLRAPIGGRTGSLLVDRGNMVKANDVNPLVVINQVRPINVSFAVPEQTLPEIRRQMAKGPLGVEANAGENDDHPAAGELSFVNNAVDPTTATIQLKATFANRELGLWPGQFVRVLLTAGSQPDALVVPSESVQVDQAGTIVFVVKPDSTAEVRRVTVSRTAERETVIAQGLQEGEMVVTDGQLRLVGGTRVAIRKSGAAALQPEAAKAAEPKG